MESWICVRVSGSLWVKKHGFVSTKLVSKSIQLLARLSEVGRRERRDRVCNAYVRERANQSKPVIYTCTLFISDCGKQIRRRYTILFIVNAIGRERKAQNR